MSEGVSAAAKPTQAAVVTTRTTVESPNPDCWRQSKALEQVDIGTGKFQGSRATESNGERILRTGVLRGRAGS